MDRYDYIESVVSFLKGVTGINYQLQLKEILAVYYKYLGKVYEMPDFYGGDQKNDGCVLKDGLFYQVFAPTRLKDSLKKEIQDKFVEDLSGLLNIIYEEKKWNGRLNNFIFIVNTFDNNLPHDSEGFFEKKVNEFKEKYAITFQYRVTNTDYVRDILTEINDIEVLKRISATLRVRNMMDYNAINEQIIMDLIIGISGNLSCQSINGESTQSYQRISSVEKISINSLDGKRDEIESIISKLDVVENAVNTINQDILYEDKFERVKEQVISKYVELSAQVRGVELYNTLVNEMLSYSQDKWNLDVPMKFLIVYIFDKCDIFEKER
ncbi:hypothetical protein LL221_002894 [Listeria innocua]|uniref:Uncharacterized protein n=1 Tax=Helcococcus kunzii ATCC 51366 TaxID=883114 RepID=H3NR74_9FIRM|nr:MULTISPECIES: hypothetical protein [Bacillota]EAF7006046.1 hypothetical protein [Listeria monocytogenes]EHL7151063.1 hypothetical protein [Listeria monocytogenes]EHR31668.1 hypothetical protein HMPREF9709_01835 [Helcococcus kunzii ATCC 51366]EHY9143938.1 hypothetical protein [Listeria innocua]EHY9475230.1 hypothetical protein [Listeria innocua]